MRGYKVFDKNLQCRNFQFVVGETYVHDGEVKLCKSGFHFCLKATDCFKYYDFDAQNRVCEVEADLVSDETENDSKRVCGKITLIRELSWYEVLELVNSGKNNTGINNSGHHNSGYSNSGNYNNGNSNSGNSNSGNSNNGNSNSGNRNSGDCNSGHYNSGHCNSGHYNSGHYNSGNYNNGLFNVDEPTVKVFGSDCGMTMTQLLQTNMIPCVSLIYEEIINDKLVKYTYKEAWKNWWSKNDEYTNKQKQKILNLPNFNAQIFEEITGIKVESK